MKLSDCERIGAELGRHIGVAIFEFMVAGLGQPNKASEAASEEPIEFLDVDQIAARTLMSRRKINSLLATGKIKSIGKRGSRLVMLSELKKWTDSPFYRHEHGIAPLRPDDPSPQQLP